MSNNAKNIHSKYHADRANTFSRHASFTRNLDVREMYLRLMERELALAERLERLENQMQTAESGGADPTASREALRPRPPRPVTKRRPRNRGTVKTRPLTNKGGQDQVS